jgi:hypothetical protein
MLAVFIARPGMFMQSMYWAYGGKLTRIEDGEKRTGEINLLRSNPMRMIDSTGQEKVKQYERQKSHQLTVEARANR